jgi:CheY-like chemotaxis protein
LAGIEPTVAGALNVSGRYMLRRFSTVLVVDDNPMARSTAVHLFEDLGFKVLDAYNGRAALRLIEAHPEIQLLFVDVRMPGMNGLELAEAAQKAWPHLKIVFTSRPAGRAYGRALRAKTLAGRCCRRGHLPRRRSGPGALIKP